MRADELRALQAPLKDRYREEPTAALVTMRAHASLGEGVTCKVQTGRALASAGLHPASGGDGSELCSGDMLLEALAAYAGVTQRAVATALEIPVEGTVTAEGDLDFRGTLGVETEAEDERVAKLIQLTERYCVALQTLTGPSAVSLGWARRG